MFDSYLPEDHEEPEKESTELNAHLERNSEEAKERFNRVFDEFAEKQMQSNEQAKEVNDDDPESAKEEGEDDDEEDDDDDRIDPLDEDEDDDDGASGEGNGTKES